MRSRCAYCEHYTCTCRPEPKQSIQVTEGKTDEGTGSVGASNRSQPNALGSGDSEQVTSKISQDVSRTNGTACGPTAHETGRDEPSTRSPSSNTQTAVDFMLLLRVLKDHVGAMDAHGCVTGDCPHERQSDCDAALAGHVAGVKNSLASELSPTDNDMAEALAYYANGGCGCAAGCRACDAAREALRAQSGSASAPADSFVEAVRALYYRMSKAQDLNLVFWMNELAVILRTPPDKHALGFGKQSHCSKCGSELYNDGGPHFCAPTRPDGKVTK